MALDAEELQEQRTYCEENDMPDVVRVHRYTGVDDEYSGRTETWTPAETYPCRVVQRLFAEPREVEVADTILSTTSWHIKTRWNADIKRQDRLEVGGDIFEVLDADHSKSERIALTVACRKLGE